MVLKFNVVLLKSSVQAMQSQTERPVRVVELHTLLHSQRPRLV